MKTYKFLTRSCVEEFHSEVLKDIKTDCFSQKTITPIVNDRVQDIYYFEVLINGVKVIRVTT